ncbi:MAG: PAS domain S-box protein [Rhodospirillales bacterium]|nr:PAS domain S-box protein [Rhodospirillales bacterium]
MKLGFSRFNRTSLTFFLLAAFGAGMATAALIGLLLSDISRQKREVFEKARQTIEFKAKLMGDHATRAFEAIDLILFSLATDLKHLDAIPGADQIRNRLHERILFLPQATTLAIYDARGRLVADAKRLDADENVSDQAFFRRHAADGILFHLEGPQPRRFDASGRVSLRLSRLLSKADGSFLGVLLAEIDPGYFRSFYREDDPLGVDEVILLDAEGRILASEQAETLQLGRHASEIPALSGLVLPNRPLSGLLRLESEQTIAVVQQLSNFSLRIAVLLDKSKLQATWRQTSHETGLVIVGAGLIYLCAMVLIALLLQRRQAAEEALRISEANLRAIHDNTDIGIVRTDQAGHILAVNPAFAKMLGSSCGELGGRSIFSLSHPDDQSDGQARFKELQSGRIGKYNLVKRYRRLDNGAYVHVRISTFLVKPGDSLPQLTFAMVEDITDAKRAKDTIEALLRRSQLILSTIGEGILGLDASGRIAFVNPAAEALLGYAAKDMIGKSSHALVHHHRSDGQIHDISDCHIHAVLSDGNPRQTSRDTFWNKDGAAVPVEYVATPMRSETGIEGAVIAFRNIKNRLESESEIMRSNAELEQFAYAVSHDLQEPLRMVASYVQLLGRRYSGKLDEDANTFIGFAVDGAKRMQQMITDLLDYSRIQRKGNPMVPISLDEPMNEALKNLDLAIGECKAKLEIKSVLPVVTADAAQMSRLFQNLIGNALKYRDKQRIPAISIKARMQDGWHIISIADNGIGIDPQYFDRIFQIFQRLHSRADYPGTGVGLAICRRIVERHGGKIWLESQPGKGSVFYVSLPAG